MTKIPPNVLKEILADPAYRHCMKYGHFGHICEGRITFDHAVIYGSKQVQEKWAIISVCEKGHSVNKFQDGGDLSKQVHLWISLERATEAEMIALSKVIPYTREKVRLINTYGRWKQIYPSGEEINWPKDLEAINY